jgi:hypothetical protein
MSQLPKALEGGMGTIGAIGADPHCMIPHACSGLLFLLNKRLI